MSDNGKMLQVQVFPRSDTCTSHTLDTSLCPCICIVYISGTSAIIDFTCVTKPRIDISRDDTYIAGYLVGTNVRLSFSRTTYTKTGAKSELPEESTEEIIPPASSHEIISILRLPAAGNETRIGAFACSATMANGAYINVGTFIMSKNGA